MLFRSPSPYKGVRAVALASSSDFRNWSDPTPIVLGGDAEQEQFYTNATTTYFRAPHYYLMFPKRYVKDRVGLPGHKGISDAMMLSSRDGLHFDRTFLEAFIRPGRDDLNWGDRSVMPAWGIVQTGPDEMSIYYSQHYRKDSAHMRRGVLRLDGFASSDLFRAVAVGSALPLTMKGASRRGTAVPSWGLGFGAGTSVYDQRMHTALRSFGSAPAGRGAWHDVIAATVGNVVDVGQAVGPSYTRPLPDSDLVRKLTLAARMVNADIGIRVVDTATGGFDTHANQPATLTSLLQQLDDGLKAFFTSLDDRFRSRVTVVVHSEFGRTSWANDSAGTDHGAASNSFVIGRGVQGGLLGAQPPLAGLGRWDRMAMQVDLRQMYAGIIDGWLGGGSSTVLGGTYSALPLFRSTQIGRAHV